MVLNLKTNKFLNQRNLTPIKKMNKTKPHLQGKGMRLLLGFLFMACMLHVVMAAAQGIEVSGTVTSTEGEGISGVTVLIKGTDTGMIMDIDGKYIIESPEETSVLQFSFIGYRPLKYRSGTCQSSMW